MNLFKIGIQDDYPWYINEKIKVTNYVNVVLLGISLMTLILNLIVNPMLFWLPLIGIVITLLTPIFFYFRVINIPRIIMSTAPVLISTLLAAYALKANESPEVSNSLLSLMFVFIPRIIFDSKEKTNMYTSVVINVVIFFSLYWLNPLLETSLETQRDNPVVVGITYFFVVVSTFGFLYYLDYESSKYDSRNTQLINDMQAKNDDLQKKEAKMNDLLKEIEISREDDKKREWAATGLAKFGELLRSIHLGEQEVYDQFISQLVKYIGANQGGLFVIEEEGDYKFLELKACYAYERKKFLEKRVEIGEGLLGQCYMEKDIIVLTQVPDNYVTITSGLGEATPGCLLLVPIKVNEDIHGVMEFASFVALDKYKIEFLEKLSENLASTISIVRINSRTKILLEQSQEQAEEMRAQEEEMRQNMEELQATQEEMARKNEQIEKIRAEEHANAIQQIEAQKKTLEKFTESAKAESTKLKERIKELEAKLS
ncbi:MAG: GAF domain-containing protein [Bacteroidota bacterium]|nr:GAF domain-containing protein [Bacteroidota bacterium]